MSATSHENYNRFVNRKVWQWENREPSDICPSLAVAEPTVTGVLVGILIACSAVAGIQA